jgi:hypothetical protein
VYWLLKLCLPLLQTARYLVKQLLAAQAGKASGVGSADYTNNAEALLRQPCSVASSRDWLDPAVQSAAFRCDLFAPLEIFFIFLATAIPLPSSTI